MKKRNLIVSLFLAGIIVVAIIIWGTNQPEKLPTAPSFAQAGNDQSDVVLYFGQECPHCKDVDKFIVDNQIEQKVIFAEREVWHNVDNQAEMDEKIMECALDKNKVGVPFLFIRGKCYIGVADVEKQFKKEAGIQ